jgi:biopolymer transport protein ExbD
MDKPRKGVFGGGVFGAESTTTEVYLNLTPLMDVMSNILFFLLAAFGTSIVAILPATTPIVSSEQTDVEKDTDKVTVAVRLTDSGLNISCQNDFMTPNELKPYEAFVPIRVGAKDIPEFTAVLRRIKERWPASKTMVLAPDDGIAYQQVIRVMDAAREQRLGESRKVILFPDVVLSGVYGAETGSAPAGARK